MVIVTGIGINVNLTGIRIGVRITWCWNRNGIRIGITCYWNCNQNHGFWKTLELESESESTLVESELESESLVPESFTALVLLGLMANICAGTRPPPLSKCTKGKYHSCTVALSNGIELLIFVIQCHICEHSNNQPWFRQLFVFCIITVVNFNNNKYPIGLLLFWYS